MVKLQKKTWITFLKTKFDKNKFTPVSNYNHHVNKPQGGLWGSPVTDDYDNIISTWHEWCVGNHFTQGLSNYYIEYNIKNDSKLYIIDNQDDFINLIESYDKVKSDLPINMFIYPNFEEISKDYDGIYLTQKGQFDTHMPFENISYNLYGWDCECLLLFTPDIITNIKEKEIDINQSLN